MNPIQYAAQQLVAEMERQNRTKAVYYALMVEDFEPETQEYGFHPVIGLSETLEVLEVEGEILMTIETISIDELRSISEL
jgi:hypothetical protein